jgi:hypothetical protein
MAKGKIVFGRSASRRHIACKERADTQNLGSLNTELRTRKGKKDPVMCAMLIGGVRRHQHEHSESIFGQEGSPRSSPFAHEHDQTSDKGLYPKWANANPARCRRHSRAELWEGAGRWEAIMLLKRNHSVLLSNLLRQRRSCAFRKKRASIHDRISAG